MQMASSHSVSLWLLQLSPYMMAHDSQQHNAGTARAYSSTLKELALHVGQASYRASPLPQESVLGRESGGHLLNVI